jgi:hypothetical protein
MHGELVHGTRLRSPQFDTFQLILRRRLAFDKLGLLALCLTQFLDDFSAQVLIYLQYL